MDARDPSLEHLREILSSDEFSRTRLQAKALEVLVSSSRAGRVLSGNELAKALYGRDDEQYLRAMRQVVRELRLKLPIYYQRHPDTSIRFEISPLEYSVRVVDATEPTAKPVPGTRWRLRAVGSVLGASVLIAAAVALVGWGSKQEVGVSPALPSHTVITPTETLVVDSHGLPEPAWRERFERALGYRLKEGPEGDDRVALLAVLDRLGRPGVLLVASNTIKGRRCDLVLFDGVTGSVLKQSQIPHIPDGVLHGGRMREEGGGEFEFTCVPESVSAMDLDGDGLRDEAVVSLRDLHHFPSIVLPFDPEEESRIRFTYWSMGWVKATALRDVDGDGLDDILLFGTNNGDQAAVLILLRSSTRNWTWARSISGRRNVVLEGIEDYPVRGVHVRFPRTHLARKDVSDYWMSATRVGEVEWDGAMETLSALVYEGAREEVFGTQLRIEFILGLDARAWRAVFVDYDAYLTQFIKLLSAGGLEDRWHVLSSERLDDYGQFLLGEIEYMDPESVTGQSWKPLTPEKFKLLFKTPGG